MQLFEQSDASNIHDAILELSSAGGYNLLWTIENSKRLRSFYLPKATYLKNVLGQAKCLITPIQNEIELIESPALEAESRVSYM